MAARHSWWHGRWYQLGLLVCALTVFGCDSTTPETHIEKATAAMANNEVNAAVLELKNALKKDPSISQARMLLGQAQLRLGDYNSALSEFERCVNAGFEPEPVKIGLLQTKVNLGRFSEVIGELEGTEDLSPALSMVLANAYLAAADGAKAKPILLDNQDDSQANVGLAMLAWRDGLLDESQVYFDKAVTIDANNTSAWLRLGEFQLAKGDGLAGQAAFEKAVALPGGYILGETGLARAYIMQGMLDEAAVKVASVLEKADGYLLAHYLDGLVKYQQGDMEGSEKALREVQGSTPEHLPTIYLLALVRYQQSDLVQAEANLEQYLSIDSSNESVRKLLASVLHDKDDPEGIVDTLKPIGESTSDPQVLGMLGTALMRVGDTSAATKILQRAVALAPDMAPFRNQLALSLLSAGQDDQALTELSSAVNVDKNQFQSDYLISLIHLKEGDLTKAAASIESLIKKNDQSPIGYNLRGALGLANKDVGAAKSAFTEALEKDPGFHPAVSNLARLAISEDNPAEAESLYKELLKHKPASEVAFSALAELSLREGDRPGAIAWFEQSRNKNPNSASVKLALARLYAADGRSKQAYSLIKEALEEDPESVELLMMGADLALRQGDMNTARANVSKLQNHFAKKPDNANFAMLLGVLQSRVGYQGMARSNLEIARKLAPDNQRSIYELARIDVTESKFLAAREKLDRLKASQDELALPADRLRGLEAEILISEEKYPQAKAILIELADQGDRNSVVRVMDVLLKEGNKDQGEFGPFHDWLKSHPDDVGVKTLLATGLLQLGNQAEALALYEELEATDNPVVLNNLAWLYMEQGDGRAVEVARRAREAAPNNADVNDTLGWVLVRAGKELEGVSFLEESVRARSTNPTTHFHLGYGYLKLQQKGRAKSALEQALSMGDFPERVEAEEALTQAGEL